MQNTKVLFLLSLTILVLGCKEGESSVVVPPPVCCFCPYPYPEFETDAFVYQKIESAQEHQVDFSRLSNLVTVESRGEEVVSKFKNYDTNLFTDLYYQASLNAHCYESPSAAKSIDLPLHQISYSKNNGTVCFLGLSEFDPLTIQIEEIFDDVINTGEDNTVTPGPEIEP